MRCPVYKFSVNIILFDVLVHPLYCLMPLFVVCHSIQLSLQFFAGFRTVVGFISILKNVIATQLRFFYNDFVLFCTLEQYISYLLLKVFLGFWTVSPSIQTKQ